ncbi:MAG: adenylosuccinate synthase [Ruminiclostridium sp.]|nr:adenylosuccinate synthase [Ruminiclostridium sp.]
MVKAVVGANWGDEGKGKMTDMLASEADYVVRFQGGSNAGHTIINQYGKFALHLLPSGVFHENTTNILGPGVALNISILMDELKNLKEKNVPMPKLLISDRAQVIMPWHIMFDRLEEERLGSKSFGSTKSGIAPFYSDKYYKTGIQVCDLNNPETLREKIYIICEVKNVLLEHLYNAVPLKPDTVIEELLFQGNEIRQMVCDTTTLLNKAIKQDKTILLEGQLGALKDPDLGIYPFTTSSSPLAGFGAIGAGIPPYEIKSIIVVIKAYSSCVGTGPFVSEIYGDAAEELRKRGGDSGEYGATTGRPRRMGWFDAVATRYGCMVQGATEAALTLLDVLGYLDEIPVCTGYETNGVVTEGFPVTYLLGNSKPVYTVLPGWKYDISDIRNFEDLPGNARDYIRFIEDAIEVPIKWVSNGPRRRDIITCK